MIVKKLIKTISSVVLCTDSIMDCAYFVDNLGINLPTSIKSLLPILSAVNIEMTDSVMNYLTLPFFFSAIISLAAFVRSIMPGSPFVMFSNIYDLMKKIIECMRFYIPVLVPFLIFDVLIWLYKICTKKFDTVCLEKETSNQPCVAREDVEQNIRGILLVYGFLSGCS